MSVLEWYQPTGASNQQPRVWWQWVNFGAGWVQVLVRVEGVI